MVYQTLYDLIISCLFNNVVITGWIELVVTCLATIGSLFVFSIPFIIVYKVICLICGR